MDDSLKSFNGINIKMESAELHDEPLQYSDLASDMYNGLFLPDIVGEEVTSLAAAPADSAAEPDKMGDNGDEDVIILHIDIQQPIKQLRKLLERRIGVNLRGYEYWLQNAQQLEANKNLVDQCLKGEGLVQINTQVLTTLRRINIVDVLKPTDDALEEISEIIGKTTAGAIAVIESPPKQDADAGRADRSGSESPAPDAATVAAAEAIERELTAQTDDAETAAATEMLANANADAMATMRRRHASDDDYDEDDVDDVEDGGGGGRRRGGEVDSDEEEEGAAAPAPPPSKPEWIIGTQFKREQNRLKMPDDPKDWTVAHVKHWLQWAVRHFNLTNIKLQDWAITGKELYELTIEDFHLKVPHDPDNTFWTHLELLRRLKVVAIQGGMADRDDYNENGGTGRPSHRTTASAAGPNATAGAAAAHNGHSGHPHHSPAAMRYANHSQPQQHGLHRTSGAFHLIAGKSPVTIPKPNKHQQQPMLMGRGLAGEVMMATSNQPQFGPDAAHQSNRTGNNGQIQLWQFLLEILTDAEHRDIIGWMGGDGEFKLTDPERVAQLWGERKNKSTMNYEKLSRALRYYYDGDMISKVHGKRFVYKFVCDLTQLVGYNALELSQLVNQSAGGATAAAAGRGGAGHAEAHSHFESREFRDFMCE